MENNNNIIAFLEAFQYREIGFNQHYLIYNNNNASFVYVFLMLIDDTNSRYVLVDGFDFTFYETQQDIIFYLNYSLQENKEFIESINNEMYQNIHLEQLVELNKINFFKTLTLTTNTSDVINSYFIYNSELDKTLSYLVTLNESLYRNGTSFVVFNEHNYRQLLFEPNYFKSIEGQQDESLFITSNPYMFAIYNQTGDKKSMLFCPAIEIETLFEAINKKHPNSFDNIEIGALNNINDLVFSLKTLLGYYNVFFKDLFIFKIVSDKIIVTLKFNIQEISKFDNELLLFAGLLGLLTLEIKEQQLNNTEQLSFTSNSYKINNLSFKQLTIPYKVEFINTFLVCFISSFKLSNISLKRDLVFEQEEQFGMFNINN
ncbi:MAG: hypothetical protein COW67_13320 [Flavobacteriales bacterium CG18_big_fil_WC_8_21_14_2_50_32_9]|nr:MAG: hypothetical protein COW67_13320 [Flavobacteriales bacterium CG18_big_fil_WC_8_21_14_2_50_32_9]